MGGYDNYLDCNIVGSELIIGSTAIVKSYSCVLLPILHAKPVNFFFFFSFFLQ